MTEAATLSKAEKTAGRAGAVENAAPSVPLMPVFIELGCGQKKLDPSWIGVDIDPVCLKLPGRNIVHDLLRFPWPFDDSCADEIYASHFFEHVPGKVYTREPDGTWRAHHVRAQFMAECYRICKPGALVVLQVPYGKNVRATQDYDHAAPWITEESFQYFNQDWLKANKLDHGPYARHYSDFEFVRSQRVYNPRVAALHPTAVQSQEKTDWDTVDDIIVTLRCRKPGTAIAKPPAVARPDPVPEQPEEEKRGPI